MSFFSAITDVFDTAVDFFGSDTGASVIEGVGALGGAAIQYAGNTAAAEIAKEGQEAQADAINKSAGLAQARFRELRDTTQPGVDRLVATTNGASSLTPQQQDSLDRLRSDVPGRLAASGLRGAGRASVDAFREIEGGFVNRALDTNARRADTAGGTLANANFGAVNNAANLDVGTGNRLSTIANNDNAANAGIANASLQGAALADISSFIADEAKGRKSKFATRTQNLQQQGKV